MNRHLIGGTTDPPRQKQSCSLQPPWATDMQLVTTGYEITRSTDDVRCADRM